MCSGGVVATQKVCHILQMAFAGWAEFVARCAGNLWMCLEWKPPMDEFLDDLLFIGWKSIYGNT